MPYIKLWRRLPAFLEDRIRRSDIVYFELDLMNAEIRRRLLDCQLLPHDERSNTYLNDKQIYKRLKYFFRTKRNEVNDKPYFDTLIRNWRFKKLIWILFLLNFLIENDSQYLRVPSMDHLISHKVRQLNKAVRSLETVDDQCTSLNSLDQHQVLSFINLTLNNYFDELNRKQQVAAQAVTKIDLLIEQYRCGTLNSSLFDLSASNSSLTASSNRTRLDHEPVNTNDKSNDKSYTMNESSDESTDEMRDKLTKQEMQAINQIFQKQLIENRNRKISDRITRELTTNGDKNLLFVVGSAHFIGNGLTNVLKRLEDRGFEIERVNKKTTNSDYR